MKDAALLWLERAGPPRGAGYLCEEMALLIAQLSSAFSWSQRRQMGLLGHQEGKGTADFRAPQGPGPGMPKALTPWAEAEEEAPSIRRAQARSEQW